MVMRDGERLMAHWSQHYSDAIQAMHYEQLVTDPANTVAELARWIGLPEAPSSAVASSAKPGTTISTASLWQARQQVHTGSIGRWKHYALHLPELARIPED